MERRFREGGVGLWGTWSREALGGIGRKREERGVPRR